MNASKNKTVIITPKTTEKIILSAAQKRFNSLTKKIDLERKRLVEWQEITPTYDQKVIDEYEPALNELNDIKSQWIFLLDQAYDNFKLTKTDKQKLQHIISEHTQELIVEFDRDELKPIFNKYNEFDYDERLDEAKSEMSEYMKGFINDMFGVEMDEDFDISSPEQFKAHLQEKLRDKIDAQEKTQAPIKERKKTKKQLEKELRLQEEEALSQQSVREIYRKLAAALHPDREKDIDERIRKTELMQRVNAAYGKKDLLKLLELQLEIEQIDAEHLTQIADSRLKYFNKILKEQLEELNREVYQIEDRFKLMLDIPFYALLTPKKLILYLNDDIDDIKANSEKFKAQLEFFKNPTLIKAWLKDLKIPKKRIEEDFFYGSFTPIR